MKLCEFIARKAIVPALRSEDRDGAILELLEAMEVAGTLGTEHREDIMLALLKREATATTALGAGVAIPHVKVRFIQEFTGAVGLSRRGIDMSAPDRKPVHVLFLFLSPEHAISGHLQLMAHIAGIARHPSYITLLRAAHGQREVEQLIDDADRFIFSEPDRPV